MQSLLQGRFRSFTKEEPGYIGNLYLKFLSCIQCHRPGQKQRTRTECSEYTGAHNVSFLGVRCVTVTYYYVRTLPIFSSDSAHDAERTGCASAHAARQYLVPVRCTFPTSNLYRYFSTACSTSPVVQLLVGALISSSVQSKRNSYGTLHPAYVVFHSIPLQTTVHFRSVTCDDGIIVRR